MFRTAYPSIRRRSLAIYDRLPLPPPDCCLNASAALSSRSLAHSVGGLPLWLSLTAFPLFPSPS